MPSSNTPETRKSGKLLKYLAGFVVLLGIIYTGGWFYLANELETRVATNLAAFRQKGIDATCENAGASGFPIRLGLDCTKVGWVDQAKKLSIMAGSFNAAAQVYDPMQIVSRIEGPAAVDAPNMIPLDITWKNLGSNVRLDKPLPKQLSVQGNDIVVNQRNAAEGTPPIAVMQDGKLSFSTAEPKMNIAWSFEKLKIADNVVYKHPLPELTGAADIELENGFDLLAKPERDATILRGQSGLLNNVDLGFADGSGIAISGPFSVDDEGRISGDFNVTMRNPEGVAQAMREILPDEESTISSVLQAMAFVPRNSDGAPTLPITVKKGKMSVGFIRIGRLPSL
ncbi:DUF2125 domain-containing protein [Phyllobacterium sp. SB3]|uniref:DUF2125 domain-containing protein n=1 Tax=Phyllobacterium sp. SB3 TaxID=3156073 RepID=UPI0032B00E8C